MHDTKTTDAPALYVGTYAKYNNGSIAGKWLKLTDYKTVQEFIQAAEALHKDEEVPELMFQDFENFPREFYSESLSIVDLEKIYDYINLDYDDREIVTEYASATGYRLEDIDLEDARDRFYTILDSRNESEQHKELGEYVLKQGILDPVPESLQGYIDYEAVGRDWMMDMSVSDNGYVFTDN